MTKQAFGIISLINVEKDKNSHLLWNRVTEVIEKCGMKIPIYPHFSWQVAVKYQIDNVIEVIQNIAFKTRKFNIQISGFGIFPGDQPVLYLTIVRSSILDEIHQKVWDACSEFGMEINPFYSATRWIPHMTIASGQVTSFDISSVVEEMAGEIWDYEIEINNLAIAYQIGDEAGIAKTISLLLEGE
jgi:2'-5' RNA ligase